MADSPNEPWIEAPNTVLAGPGTGADRKAASFRAIVAADLPAGPATAVAGVAAGYKLARGSADVTGTLAVNTGLATLGFLVLSLAKACSSGAAWVSHSALASAGWSLLQVWALTSSGDATPVASDVAARVNWISVGT